MYMSLENKVVIVTGGGNGIGAATAKLFAEKRAKVIIADVNLEAAAKKAEEITNSGGIAFPLQLDVSNNQQVKETFQAVAKEHGQINVLVNNAGITRDALLLKMTEKDFDRVIAVNLKGPFNCIQGSVEHMPRNNGSVIVNVASIVGRYGNVGQTNYAASKGGLITMSLSLAKELAYYGIRVNVVAPGFIKTGMTEVMNPKAIDKVMASTPLKRMGTPEDVARAILYLVTEEFITGEVLDVNGGLVLN